MIDRYPDHPRHRFCNFPLCFGTKMNKIDVDNCRRCLSIGQGQTRCKQRKIGSGSTLMRLRTPSTLRRARSRRDIGAANARAQ